MSKPTIFNYNTPLTYRDVQIYFSQKGMPELEAEHFYRFYEIRQRRSKKGKLFTNWKSIAHDWIVSAISMICIPRPIEVLNFFSGSGPFRKHIPIISKSFRKCAAIYRMCGIKYNLLYIGEFIEYFCTGI
jgi:hypothetical protein